MTTIRSIQKKDDPAVAKMIRDVLVEQGAPKTGTAYEDYATDNMFETYDKNRSDYFLLEENGELIGSAGISPLAGETQTVCELQKMYFLPEARGRGLGGEMMHYCLDFAKKQNFKAAYIETLQSMIAAQKLYKKTGFKQIDKRLGETGHYSCTVWLLKDL
jgi:putative acetyltransferase